MRSPLPYLLVLLAYASKCEAQPHDLAGTNTLAARFDTPSGFVRSVAAPTSFGTFLRNLPLKPAGASVHLYDGGLKYRQDVHAAVIDMSVGRTDLQQCADAVMRLRAEYLYQGGEQDKIAFEFTNGFRCEWRRWREGDRVRVNGNKCTWLAGSPADGSHAQLLRYLDKVFTYAGTRSLQRELDRSTAASSTADRIHIGDVLIQGGSPGHAIIVVDQAVHTDGRMVVLLAQSYMPAQEIHVLRNLRDPRWGAWFPVEPGLPLHTPEWTFNWNDRRCWE